MGKQPADEPSNYPLKALESSLVSERLAALPLQSLLEVSASASPAVRHYCHTQNVRYQHALPTDCSDLSGRFDLALVHGLESLALSQVRPCLGILRNLLSERVWLMVKQHYCADEEWISLGFKRDPIPNLELAHLVSFSYNLETYNHKRDWNNTRYWANPEHWDKRF